MFCNGCEHKRHPVHGTNMLVEWLLDMDSLKCCGGCDPKRRPVHGISYNVCVLLRQVRKWTCSSALNCDTLHNSNFPFDLSFSSNAYIRRQQKPKRLGQTMCWLFRPGRDCLRSSSNGIWHGPTSSIFNKSIKNNDLGAEPLIVRLYLVHFVRQRWAQPAPVWGSVYSISAGD